jgi:hypothetical protein
MPSPAADLGQNPFALLSLIAAPAVLTNAASVLALSTSNRFLRASERMRALSVRTADRTLSHEVRASLLRQANSDREAGGAAAQGTARGLRGARLVRQRELDLHPGGGDGRERAALRISCAERAGAGCRLHRRGGLVTACLKLLQATRLSMVNMSEEAALIRAREQTSSPAV